MNTPCLDITITLTSIFFSGPFKLIIWWDGLPLNIRAFDCWKKFPLSSTYLFIKYKHLLTQNIWYKRLYFISPFWQICLISLSKRFYCNIELVVNGKITSPTRKAKAQRWRKDHLQDRLTVLPGERFPKIRQSKVLSAWLIGCPHIKSTN